MRCEPAQTRHHGRLRYEALYLVPFYAHVKCGAKVFHPRPTAQSHSFALRSFLSSRWSFPCAAASMGFLRDEPCLTRSQWPAWEIERHAYLAEHAQILHGQT